MALRDRRHGVERDGPNGRDRQLDHASGSADTNETRARMSFEDRHVVVTGGTGALGTAVVGALIEAGAMCHVPYRSEDEAQRFPHRGHRQVSLVALGDLADETAVNSFYGGLSKLWASI